MAMLFVFLVCVHSEVTEIGAKSVKYAVESNKRVSVHLTWSRVNGATFYRIFQRKCKEEWRTISTFDETTQKRAIKVLNAFPSEHSTCSGPAWYGPASVHTAYFVYADGTNITMSKSSALKVWMEGGSIDGVRFTGYGRNSSSDDTFIKVDVIPSDDLDMEPQLIWNYDIVVFGSWDASGGRREGEQDCNFPEASVVSELERYLSLGYSVIASHDVIGLFSGTNYGLGPIRSYFGIKVGGTLNNDFDANNVEMKNKWRYETDLVEIVKRGQVVEFPWEVTGKTLKIINSHTYGNIATGDVWIRLVPMEYPYNRAFEYTFPGGDTEYYLTTKNNTAMIQTGHLYCNATDDERKIFANLIVHMKQRTTGTSVIDHSCHDEDAPTPPICTCNKSCSIYSGKYSIECTSEDTETMYEYRIEGCDDSGSIIAASQTSVDVASGLDYFIYHIDTETTMTQTDLLSKSSRLLPGEKMTGIRSESSPEYLHILAIDRSGNPSTVTDFPLSDCRLVTHEWMEIYNTRLHCHAFPWTRGSCNCNSLVSLTWKEWITCVAFALGTFTIGFLVRLIKVED